MRREILGIQIDSLTLKECVEKINKARNRKQYLRIVTANPEMIYKALKDNKLKEVINTADLITPDGVGVVWAAKFIGEPVPERVAGIDLVEQLLPIANEQKWKIFFLGAKPGVAELAKDKVLKVYPDLVIECAHGYFQGDEEAQIIEVIQNFKPDLLLVGLGAGRQEKWIEAHPGLAFISIGVGGTFDTLAGLNKRAPLWMRKAKLEWFYRLVKEPKRLKRQLALPAFVFKVICEHKKK